MPRPSLLTSLHKYGKICSNRAKVLYRGAFALLFYLGEGMICADRAVQGVCVRALAMSGDTLFRFFEQFEKLL